MSLRFKNVPKIVSAVGVRVIAGFVLASGAGATAAYAQQCDCSVPLAGLSAGQVVGQFTSVSGQVNVLGGNGWVSAANGTPLYVGSQVETAAGSAASISVPGCSVNVGALSSVSLAPVNQALCVSVAETAPVTAPGNTPAPVTGVAPVNNPVVMGIAGGFGAVAGVVAVSTGDDSPASP